MARKQKPKARRQRLEPGRRFGIVRDIIERLGTKERAQVVNVIRRSFRGHQRYRNLFARKGHETRITSATRISKHVAALQSELEAAPALLLDYAFRPPPSLHQPSDQADLEAYLAAPMRQRLAMLEMLQAVRLACVKFLADEAKAERLHGPEHDRDQRHCATLAYLLFGRFSTTERITGSDNGDYRVITSLLYELYTGRDNVDLKRHCDWLMRNPPPYIQVSAVDHG
jgi:hypothetical protein